jgi:hypothetical protein
LPTISKQICFYGGSQSFFYTNDWWEYNGINWVFGPETLVECNYRITEGICDICIANNEIPPCENNPNLCDNTGNSYDRVQCNVGYIGDNHYDTYPGWDHVFDTTDCLCDIFTEKLNENESTALEWYGSSTGTTEVESLYWDAEVVCTANPYDYAISPGGPGTNLLDGGWINPCLWPENSVGFQGGSGRSIIKFTCNANIEDIVCLTHSECNLGEYCHSGWNGYDYSDRYCVEYYNGYCTDNICGIGDGDCDNNNECNDGICGTNNCTFYSQNITSNADCCEPELVIEGCTDNMACNYNNLATEDNGSCNYPEPYCQDIDNDGMGSGPPTNYCVGNQPQGWVLDCTDDCECDVIPTYDCFGICCGDSELDECGICDGLGPIFNCSTIPGRCELNNNYVCNSNSCSYIDECGVCAGSGAQYQCCQFSNNEWKYTCTESECITSWDADNDNICNADDDCVGVVDDCGVCNGPNTDCSPPVPNSNCPDRDCYGQCFGTALDDCAGFCYNPGVGFNEEPQNIIDQCGICNGDNSCMGCIDNTATNFDSTVTVDDGSCIYTPTIEFISPIISPTEVFDNRVVEFSLNYELGIGTVIDTINWVINPINTNGVSFQSNNSLSYDTISSNVSINIPDLSIPTSLFILHIIVSIRGISNIGIQNSEIEQFNLDDIFVTVNDSGQLDIILGDANLDGQVNIVDIIKIVSHIMGENSLALDEILRADINGDGIVNINDIIPIIHQIINSGQMTTQQGEQIINEVKRRLKLRALPPLIRPRGKKQQISSPKNRIEISNTVRDINPG